MDKNQTVKVILSSCILTISLHFLFTWNVILDSYIWILSVYYAIIVFIERVKLNKYLFLTTLSFLLCPIISYKLNIHNLLGKYLSLDPNESNFVLLLTILANGLILINIFYFNKYYFLVEDELDSRNYETSQDQIYNEIDSNFNDATNPELKKIYSKILYDFDNNKSYLSSDINLKKISKNIGSNTLYVSKAINYFNKTNFNDFINKYRVEYFKEICTKKDINDSNIKDIYILCGFNHQSTFNRVFKQFENMTPKEYINNQKIQAQKKQS